MFERMNEAPIAVISGASLGAWRSRRYATNSTVTLISPQDHEGEHEEPEDRPDEDTHAVRSVEMEHLLDERRADHPSEHEDVAVGEVDQLEDPVHERVAESDEGVERAVGEADEEDLEEVGGVLDRVDDEPGDDRRDERQPDVGRCLRDPALPDPDDLRVGPGDHGGRS